VSTAARRGAGGGIPLAGAANWSRLGVVAFCLCAAVPNETGGFLRCGVLVRPNGCDTVAMVNCAFVVVVVVVVVVVDFELLQMERFQNLCE
jgi:hypothetical protein